MSLQRDSSKPQTNTERARGKATFCCRLMFGLSQDCSEPSLFLVVALMCAEAGDVSISISREEDPVGKPLPTRCGF